MSFVVSFAVDLWVAVGVLVCATVTDAACPVHRRRIPARCLRLRDLAP
jgi:hypothetical protein